MIDYIIKYYDNYDEDNRLAFRHGQVEYITTMRYIENIFLMERKYKKSAREQDGIAMQLPKKVMW